MKKLVLSLVLGASLAVAPSVFALSSMTADNMKAATGQAGVTIAVDGVAIESFAGSTAYIDTDGTVPGTPAGAIIIGQRHTLKNYDALANGDAYTTQFMNKVNTLMAADATFTPYTAADVKGAIAQASGLTIDVGACALLSAANFINIAGNEGQADIRADGTLDTEGATTIASITSGITTATTAMYGVVLGLPTLLITTSADSYTVSSAMALADGTFALSKQFIKIQKGASTMAILGGKVEIAAH